MNKKIKILIILLIVFVIAGFIALKIKNKTVTDEVIREITPVLGSIQATISTTGTVLPKNRLEIKPPVPGRVDSILVVEGEDVKKGQTLAWMSSTERAALLDAAEGQGPEQLKYWKEAYKPIALLAPIDAEVIVATTQPGQTVTASDAVIVLSDHLIVRAQVDETDIGKIRLDQKAVISLDAYPDNKIKASVEHIYYESETVNNVTIYKVDLIPVEVPDFFRSGMNVTVDFIIVDKENVLLVPVEAVRKDNNESYLLIKQENNKNLLKRSVELGVTDDKNYEVISGVSVKEIVIISTKEYVLPSINDNGSANPFLPKMPSRKKNSSIAK